MLVQVWIRVNNNKIQPNIQKKRELSKINIQTNNHWNKTKQNNFRECVLGYCICNCIFVLSKNHILKVWIKGAERFGERTKV